LFYKIAEILSGIFLAEKLFFIRVYKVYSNVINCVYMYMCYIPTTVYYVRLVLISFFNKKPLAPIKKYETIKELSDIAID